jgi:hypothetical protein
MLVSFSFQHKIIVMVSVLITYEELSVDIISDLSFGRSFSIKEKREYAQAVDIVKANQGVSLRQACSHVGIRVNYYIRYKKSIHKLGALEECGTVVAHKTNGSTRKIHPGCKSVQNVIQEDLTCFVSDTHHLVIQVSMQMVRQEACQLLPLFRNKSITAMKKSITRFTKHMGLSLQSATHTAQKNFFKMEQESKHFVAMVMRDKMKDKDPDDIINVDQTPIPFLFHSTKTLKMRKKLLM